MREGKLEAKQEVMYLGNLKVTNTRYGQFVRARRYDLDQSVAKEVLKIPGFVVPYFLGKYIGPAIDRKIRERDQIISCPRDIWVKLPITIQYKIRADTQFQVGPPVTDDKAIQLLKQQSQLKVIVSRPKFHPKAKLKEIAAAEIDRPIEKIEVKSETEKKETALSDIGISNRLIRALEGKGISTAEEIPGMKELLEIRGIGSASARLILNKVKNMR